MWAIFKIPKGLLLLIVFFIIVLMHLQPFLVGYRLTADDIQFHHLMMIGWDASWDWIKAASMDQGRIGNLVNLPFALLGAHYAENYSFRFFYTLLYFSNFFLIGVWASFLYAKAFSKNIVFFISILLISFHPLDFHHLAPNSYPLSVSLPLFIILVSRIGLCRLRRTPPEKKCAQEYSLLLLFFCGVMFGEYGFLFGASLVASEYFSRTVQIFFQNTTSENASNHSFNVKFFLVDASPLFIFLALYFGFRFAFPSSYDGNKIPDDFNSALFAKTLFGHIYGGTSFASFFRNSLSILNYVRNIGILDITSVVVIFISTFYVSKYCLSGQIFCKELRSGETAVFATSGLLIAGFITAPLALTEKYQDWCDNLHSCVYLDSRVSFLGFGLICATLVFWALHFKQFRESKITIISSIIAACGAMSFLTNKVIAQDMSDYSSAWDRAKLVGCFEDYYLPRAPISRLVDPRKRLNYHPWFDAERYWLMYSEEHKERCEFPISFDQIYPPINHSRTLKFTSGSNDLVYLLSGWSYPEPWGVWSDSQVSFIFLPIATASVQSIFIYFDALLHNSHPGQRVEISINGTQVFSDTVHRPIDNSLELRILDATRVASSDSFTMEFRFPDAVSPADLGLGSDPRILALGLKEISFQ